MLGNGAALLGQIPFDLVTYRRDGPLSRFGERMFRFAQLFIERDWDGNVCVKFFSDSCPIIFYEELFDGMLQFRCHAR